MADKIVIPEGHDPAEFLNDERLAAYYADLAEKAKGPDKADALRTAQHYARSARLTSDSVALTHALGEAELADNKK
jgi:hypothetical protein